VHEIGLAGDRAQRDAQRLQDGRLGVRRRRVARVAAIGLVEGDPHLHAARRGGADRVGDRFADRPGEAHVVEREVERAPRLAHEADQPLGHVLGALAAVGEGGDVHGCR